MRFLKSLVISSSILLANTAWATYILSPTEAQIVVDKTDKKPHVRSFYIDNKGKEPVAIEVSMKKRIVKKDGTLEVIDIPQKEVDELFTIYPKQFVVKQNEKRTIRMTYKGPKDIKEEQNYRFVISRIYVRHNKEAIKNKKGAFLDLTVEYHGSLYITPTGAACDITVSKFELKADEKNPALLLTMNNTGNAHKIVEDYAVKVDYLDKDNKKKSVELKSSDIPKDLKIESRGNILPGQKRVMTFPINNNKDIKKVLSVEMSKLK